MKGLKLLFLLGQLFVQLPLSIYLTYLVYSHIQAPEQVWFVWVVSIVFGAILTFGNLVVMVIAEDTAKKDAVKEILAEMKKRG